VSVGVGVECAVIVMHTAWPLGCPVLKGAVS
jgi:hypothetical protein